MAFNSFTVSVIKDWLLSWGMLLASVCFNALGAIVIKSKMNEVGKIELQSFRETLDYGLVFLKSPVVVISLILFFSAPFLFAVALSRLPLSIAYPVQVGLNFLLVLLLSFFFLSESMTAVKLGGIFLIMVGVIMLNK